MSQVPAVVHFNDTNDHSPPTALTRTYTTAKANGVFVFIEMWVAVVVVEFAMEKVFCSLH